MAPAVVSSVPNSDPHNDPAIVDAARSSRAAIAVANMANSPNAAVARRFSTPYYDDGHHHRLMMTVIIIVKQRFGEQVCASAKRPRWTTKRVCSKWRTSLREKGFSGLGVAEVMKEAGFTHGGFYNHFGSKEILRSRPSSQPSTRRSHALPRRPPRRETRGAAKGISALCRPLSFDKDTRRTRPRLPDGGARYRRGAARSGVEGALREGG